MAICAERPQGASLQTAFTIRAIETPSVRMNLTPVTVSDMKGRLAQAESSLQ